MKLVIDGDIIAYRASALAQDTSIEVKHIPTNKIKVFKNRTEFYGNHVKKNGGFLAEVNADREKPFELSEFEIVDKLEPKPVEFALQIAKSSMEGLLERLDVSKNFYGYLGKDCTYRLDLSTLLEYKGNRKGNKPYHLDAVKQYMADRWKFKIVSDKEADDYCTTDAYTGYKAYRKSQNRKDMVIQVSYDKDACGTEGWLFNPDAQSEPKLVEGYGYLYKDEKEIRGYGRIFKLFQIAYGDSVDNYKANCFSEQKWGKVSAYDKLKGTTTDKEGWEVLIDIYKHLYPEPKKVTGWRGDELEIDWLYVLQENTNMAHMQRWDGDMLNVEEVLKALKVNY